MTTINYLYVAEVTSKEHRSVLAAFGPILVSLGVLIVYTMGYLSTWERTALVSSTFSALTVVTMLVVGRSIWSLIFFFFLIIQTLLRVFLNLQVPESPAWYVSRNKLDEAYQSLFWLRRNSRTAETELKTLVNSKIEIDDTKDLAKPSKRISLRRAKDFFGVAKSPAVYKPFFILLFFFIFQIGSGIYVFLFYATQIFQEFGTNYNENLITVTIGVFRFLMAIVGALLMAKIGRRPLGMFSGSCMSFALLVVCVYEFFADSMSSTYQFVPFVSILFHVGFSMTGFLQLPWILTSELFPLRCRGLLTGIVSSFAYFSIFISVKFYSDLLRILELKGLLWGFFVMSFLGSLFVYFFMPETKDKSLKDISKGFTEKKSQNESQKRKNPLKKVVSTIGVNELAVINNSFQKLNTDMILDASMITIRI